MFNMTNFPELDVKNIVIRLYEQNALNFILDLIKKCLLNKEIVESCLDCLENILIIDQSVE
jgi:hypothetical protein